MITTKGRYSLRIMLDLAHHSTQAYIPMKEVAARQELSLKYLERILPDLTKAGLVEGVHGKGGGYRLTRAPEDYTVWEILCAAEGDLAPVACVTENGSTCKHSAECVTLPLWMDYYRVSRAFFESRRLSDLMVPNSTDSL